MKPVIFFLFLSFSSFLLAQSADQYFNASAYAYVQNDNDYALTAVNEGLGKYPSNKKLQELKKKIEEQKENEQQQRQQGENQEQDQNSEKNPDESNSEQQSGQQDGRNEGQEGTGSSDEDPLNAEGKENAQNNRNQGERLQQQRYDNILKALENQEQNTKRRLMMGQSKSKFGRKQKDW